MLRKGRFNLGALFAPLLAAAWLLGPALPAHAGCGCDHPPPAFAPVMPPFAPPGASVLINLEKGRLKMGNSYGVSFSPIQGAREDTVGVAVSPSAVVVSVPEGMAVGPAALKVTSGRRTLESLEESSFTVLSPLPVVPAEGGALEADRMDAAVTTDGTLLIPVNVRHVQQDTQFAIQLSDLPLEFGADDVVFHNIDGFDLTLFTLAVEGQTEMQWGSYYGWEVDEDGGLSGVVYDNKVKRSGQPSRASDVLTYWRHEFATYTAAHQPGASHAVTAGFHPDGTLHVNHGHLILAIQGMVRNANHPDDPSKMSPLAPGRVSVTVQMLAVPADGPIEPDEMTSELAAQTSFSPFGAPEGHFDEFAGSGLLMAPATDSRLIDSATSLLAPLESLAY